MNANPNRTRVLLVEDMTTVRYGLRKLLEGQADLEVVGDTEDGQEALKIVEEQAPDVVLLDLVLATSSLDGLEVLKQLTLSSPSTHVVVLSAYSSDDYVFPALEYGANAYMLKRDLPDEIFEAIRDAARGLYRFSPLIVQKIVERLRGASRPTEGSTLVNPEDKLTKREKEILPLLRQGKSNQDIADALVIAHSTVKTHVSNILHKLGITDRTKIGLVLLQDRFRPLD